MDSNCIKIWPREGFYVAPADQDIVAEILRRSQLFDHIPAAPEILVEIGRKVPAEGTVAAAHGEWREEYFPNVETLRNLPRQLISARTPQGLVHVTVSAIDKRTPGMGSHFGFKGYFLSLFVDTKNGIIWDARGEAAT